MSISILLIAVAILLSACAYHPPGKGIRPSRLSAQEYLAHGMEEVGAADTLRLRKSPMPVMEGVFGWPPDHEKWLQHLQKAEDDFRTILDRFPTSPEAAEAQFMLGMMNDHPYRNRFDDAVIEYKNTIAGFPGTSAAEKASDRIAIIEAIQK